LAEDGGAAAYANHRAEGFLDPTVLHLECGQYQVVIAREMLAEA
jgi:hypothetical protein